MSTHPAANGGGGGGITNHNPTASNNAPGPPPQTVRLKAMTPQALQQSLRTLQAKCAEKGTRIVKIDVDDSGTMAAVVIEIPAKVSPMQWAVMVTEVLKKLNERIYDIAGAPRELIVDAFEAALVVDSLLRKTCELLGAEAHPSILESGSATVTNLWKPLLQIIVSLPGAAGRIQNLFLPSRLRSMSETIMHSLPEAEANVRAVNKLATAMLGYVRTIRLLQQNGQQSDAGSETSRSTDYNNCGGSSVSDVSPNTTPRNELLSRLCAQRSEIHTMVVNCQLSLSEAFRVAPKVAGPASMDSHPSTPSPDSLNNSNINSSNHMMGHHPMYSNKTGFRSMLTSEEELTAASRTPPCLTWSEIDDDSDDDDESLCISLRSQRL